MRDMSYTIFVATVAKSSLIFTTPLLVSSIFSPFQPVEDAAEELQGLVEAAMADEKAKEETIRDALSRAMGTQEDIKKQVVTLSGELESFRDMLVQEVNNWCEQHLHRLETVGEAKQANLLQQKEQLQAQIDALASHQRNVLGTVNAAKGPEDVVPVSLRLLEKVSDAGLV